MQLLPITGILSAGSKGTSSANTAVKTNTGQWWGFRLQGQHEELDLLTAPVPWCLNVLRCAERREDAAAR